MCHCEERSDEIRRHCEERSDEIRCHCEERSGKIRCHCEERSDAIRCHCEERSDAILRVIAMGLQRYKNRHCEERSDAAIYFKLFLQKVFMLRICTTVVFDDGAPVV